MNQTKLSHCIHLVLRCVLGDWIKSGQRVQGNQEGL